MITVVLIVALAAALACPVHMAWHMRHGGRTWFGGGYPQGTVGQASLPPGGAARAGSCCGHGQQSANELRARRTAVAAELARREATDRAEVLR